MLARLVPPETVREASALGLSPRLVAGLLAPGLCIIPPPHVCALISSSYKDWCPCKKIRMSNLI